MTITHSVLVRLHIFRYHKVRWGQTGPWRPIRCGNAGIRPWKGMPPSHRCSKSIAIICVNNVRVAVHCFNMSPSFRNNHAGWTAKCIPFASLFAEKQERFPVKMCFEQPSDSNQRTAKTELAKSKLIFTFEAGEFVRKKVIALVFR